MNVIFDYFFNFVVNEVLPEPASFTIEWFSTSLNNGVFKGKFYVLGKGDVYILCTEKKSVSIQDVYHFGENVNILLYL